MHFFLSIRSKASIILSLASLAVVIGGLVLVAGIGVPVNKAQAQGLTYSRLSPMQKRLLSGLVSSEIKSSPQNAARTQAATNRSFFSTNNTSCPRKLENNIPVNQNCLNITDTSLQGRGQTQTEPTIAADPFHPGHLVAGLNDYRSGDSMCGSAFSQDGGQSWTETAVPMGFSNGANFGGVAREYWQASGNTSVAWDTKGNAYLNCEAFMREPGTTNNPDLSSAFYIFRAIGNGGASWDFPGHPVVEAFTQNPAVLVDKPYMSIDNHVGSPFQDRIYVTWTNFSGDGSIYIDEAYSSDFGATFSAPVLVSTTSPLCVNTFGAGTSQGPCNANEFSQPFTGPDGALYVVYDNFNTALSDANDNHYQIFLSKSTDGGRTFNAPVLVANYHDFPDCATYQGGQNPFETCIPEKGATQNSIFRATDYPTGAIDPANGSIVVTFGSYISRYSSPATGCVPVGFTPNGSSLYNGVKLAGACSNKILESVSTNGGASFNGTITDPTTLTVVSSAPAQRSADQWFQWADFTKDGELVVSYYDRQYGNDEATGTMDFSLSGSRNLQNFATRRVSSSTMPLPTQFPDAQGNGTFLSDYTGLAVGYDAHPIWMDTRRPDLALCPGTGVAGVPPRVCTFTSAPNGPLANDQEVLTSSLDAPTP